MSSGWLRNFVDEFDNIDDFDWFKTGAASSTIRELVDIYIYKQPLTLDISNIMGEERRKLCYFVLKYLSDSLDLHVDVPLDGLFVSQTHKYMFILSLGQIIKTCLNGVSSQINVNLVQQLQNVNPFVMREKSRKLNLLNSKLHNKKNENLAENTYVTKSYNRTLNQHCSCGALRQCSDSKFNELQETGYYPSTTLIQCVKTHCFYSNMLKW